MSAAKLATGYIELAVKTDGNAMKDITASITGIEKQAQKSGKAAGDAISKGVNDGVKKSVGKSTVWDDMKSAAEKAGTDAGKSLNKGVTEGAKSAGKSINDEITTATKKTKSDVENTKIEPKIETKSAKTEVGGLGKVIKDAVRDAAKDAGWSLEDLMQEAAKRAGQKVGSAIHDALEGTAAGDILNDITTRVGAATDGFHHMQDALTGIKQGDAAGALNDISGALSSIGQTDAAGKVGDVGKTVQTYQDDYHSLKSDLSDVSGLLSGLGSIAPVAAGAFATIGAAAEAAAVPIAALLAAIKIASELSNHAQVNPFASGNPDPTKGFNSPIQGHPGAAVIPIPGSAPAVEPGYVPAPSGAGASDPFAASTPHELLKNLPGFAGGTDDVPPPPSGDDQKRQGGWGPQHKYHHSPHTSKGSFITGPGTGTSDSILGVGADGIPTALVSNGEGVVKADAMNNGGAAVVSALNGGMKLPGYDDGTNNVGGPPIPMPEIKVPQAEGGQAGGFNQWLQGQQGKAYQYGTMYDCSGFMSQVYNQMTGKQMPRFNTESDLAAYGFMPGSKPGTFQLGIHHGGGGPNSHMAGTLPDGRPVESGGSGVKVGAGAHGASDPQFEDHWFLPGSEGSGAAMPGGGQTEGAPLGQKGAEAGAPLRTQGYIPAGAGGSGQSGSSMFSGFLNMGASAINGLIDQGASAAATAVSAAATAGSFGAGGQAAGPAASFAIGLGTQAAKRGVSYGFQMAGIGIDALVEDLSPFGVPRWFQTDPTQFMPQIPNQAAGATTGEKAAELQDPNKGSGLAPGQDPGGPVQPQQLPGQAQLNTPAQAADAGKPLKITAPTTPGGPAAAPTPGAPSPLAPGPAVNAPPPPAPPVQAPPPPQPAPQQPKQPLDWLQQDLPGMRTGGTVGVFDDGGWLMPNQVAINKSKRPEPILNTQQWSSVQAAAKNQVSEPMPGGGSSNDYSVQIGNVTVTDVNELKNQIDSRQRLQMMRYSGRP